MVAKVFAVENKPIRQIEFNNFDAVSQHPMSVEMQKRETDAGEFSTSQMREIFPLPLTAFERYMLVDDRPQWPMTFCVQLQFRGSLDRAAFETAVRDSLARHPLLRTRVELLQRVPHWGMPDTSPVRVEWLPSDGDFAGDTITHIDLHRDTGLRVLATSGTTSSNAWLQFHHACCDGLGARRFIVDLMTGYARAIASDGSGPAWDDLDYESLKRRHEFAISNRPIQAQTSFWEKIRGAYHFHVLTPHPLAAVKGSNPQAKSRIAKQVFDAEFTNRLRQRAKSMGASLNDVAMGLLFLTLADWNRTHGAASRGDRLRIMMPTDLRETRDDRMPAANRMSFSFIARTIEQCQSVSELLAGIRAETQYIKQVRIGLDFLGGVALAQKIPGVVPLLVNSTRCMATALLTNLGDPTKRFRRRFPSQDGAALVGNVLLDAIFGTPPLRPQTHAGFGICICASKLCLSMQGHAPTLGDGNLELFQSYVHKWRDFGSGSDR